jgi:hypothetical protein
LTFSRDMAAFKPILTVKCGFPILIESLPVLFEHIVSGSGAEKLVKEWSVSARIGEGVVVNGTLLFYYISHYF